MESHSSIPAWRIQWTEERGRLHARSHQSHGANEEVSWGMPTSERLCTSLEMPCAPFFVQDKFVKRH